MAAHRALQASGSSHLQQLRMVVPGAGPYNVQSTRDGLVELVRDEQPVLGALINPGVLLFKVRYRCGGEEKIQSGSLTVLR